MALLLIPPKIQFFDNNGEPLKGGKVYTYQAGTSTPKVTYKDKAQTQPNTNPVILDSIRGEAVIRLDGSYKIDVHDSSDVQLPGYPIDNITEYDLRDWSALTASIADLNATDTSTLAKTADYPIILSDRGKTILVDATAATPTTVTLLNAATAGNGYQITIKKIDKTTNVVNIDAATSQLIDGLDPFVLYDYNDFVKVLSDGSNWHLIAAKTRGTLITKSTTPFAPTLSDENNFYLIDASSGAFAINLPAINTLASGFKIGIKKTDSTSNIVTITPNGSETIDGASSLGLTDQYEAVWLKNDGSNWYIISEYGSNSSRTNPLPKNYRSGVILVNNTGDTAHDIDFNIGKWRSFDDTTNLELSALMTKRIDANWVAGTGNGGFPSGISLSQDTWYHGFLIGKTDGTTDAGFDSDLTAVNLLADATGYTKYRRVGSIKTEATTTNIIQFIQYDNLFLWDSPLAAFDYTGNPAAAVSATLKTPLGIKTNAYVYSDLSAGIEGAQPVIYSYLSSKDTTDLNPVTVGSARSLRVQTNNVRGTQGSGDFYVVTDVNSQIRARTGGGGATTTLEIGTKGWLDFFDNL